MRRCRLFLPNENNVYFYVETIYISHLSEIVPPTDGQIAYFDDMYFRFTDGIWLRISASDPAVSGLYRQAVALEQNQMIH